MRKLRTLKDLPFGYWQIGRIWIFLLVSALAAGAGHAQTWSWTSEKVDRSGRFTSLAVDGHGNLHLSYAEDISRTLKYAFRSAESSHWYNLEIDRNVPNIFSRLALDPQGNPHICYPDEANLKYGYWDGKRWIIQEISPGGAKEYSCSLTISSDGTPFVSWYQTRGPNGAFFYHIRTAMLRDGAWLARTVDYDGEAGKWNSTVVDNLGQPYISYSIFPTGELKLAHWDGKNWQIGFIDSVTGDTSSKVVRGMGNCLRIDSQGKLRVSYFGDKDLRYAVQDGDRWVVQKVDEINPLGSWIGYLSSLGFDKAGYPHISYDDSSALKHAYWDGKKWHIQIIAPGGSDPYRYSSLAISADDTIYISYRDPQDSSLKVAVGRRTEPSSSEATAAPAAKKD
jgi:hypothetical protein